MALEKVCEPALVIAAPEHEKPLFFSEPAIGCQTSKFNPCDDLRHQQWTDRSSVNASGKTMSVTLSLPDDMFPY